MTLTLLDPRFWLAAVLWTAAVAFLSHERGARVERKLAQAEDTRKTNEALQAKADADANTREIERLMAKTLATRQERYEQEKARAKSETDRLIADVRANARRLSIPVRTHCEAGTASSGAIAGGSGQEGRAELDPGAGEFLISLTARGDNAILKHAEVVDRYELLRKACTGQLDPSQ